MHLICIAVRYKFGACLTAGSSIQAINTNDGIKFGSKIEVDGAVFSKPGKDLVFQSSANQKAT